MRFTFMLVSSRSEPISPFIVATASTGKLESIFNACCLARASGSCRRARYTST